MQRLWCLLGLFALGTSLDVTPVQKVVQMIESMKEKGKKELEEEAVQYAKFEEFCETTLTEKGRSISEASEKIETLTADAEAASADAKRLETELAQHQMDLESQSAEKANATSIREKARGDYLAALKDYTESIDAIGRALKVLKAQAASPSLVQLEEVKKMLPMDAIQSIDAYLEHEKKSSLIMQTAKEPSYEFQSGGVVSLLEDLEEKFVAERGTLEKEELAKKHAYEKLDASLAAQVAQSKKAIESKSQFKAKRLQSKASAEGDLQETSSEKASDEKYAKDLKATCEKKAAAYAERQQLRKEELEALSKAQEIIAGDSVAGHAKTHLPSLLQKSTSLAFLRSVWPGSPGADGADAARRAAKFLQQRAAALNSRVLSAMAGRVGADPVAKVKTMIEQLLVKMEEQANAEETKKGWCDAELASNKAIREEKEDVKEGLQSEIDETEATITKLSEELVTLKNEITSLEEAMSNATDLRGKEKKKNEATLKDAKEAQEAVAQATNVLKDFYAKAGEASLLQAEVFGDEAYKGMESGGVLSMLEVIATDFARLEAETKAAETAGKKEFDEFMEDSKVDKVTKTKTSEHKSSKKQTKSQELTMLMGDMQGTQKELDAANAYYEKLKPDCVDTGMSYAERKAQREQELKDLQTALDMLNEA